MREARRDHEWLLSTSGHWCFSLSCPYVKCFSSVLVIIIKIAHTVIDIIIIIIDIIIVIIITIIIIIAFSNSVHPVDR